MNRRPHRHMICPIRPHYSNLCNCSNGKLCPVRDDEEGWKSLEEAPIAVERDEMVQEVPDDVLDADDNVAIQPGDPLPEPRLPSAAEIARHNITHLPIQILVPSLCGRQAT